MILPYRWFGRWLARWRPPAPPAPPDPRQQLYRRLPRLLAAVRNARSVMDTLYLSQPPDDAPDVAHAEFETAADAAAKVERHARNKLIALLIEIAGNGDDDTAVMLSDGGIIAFSADGDGLAVVGPGQVHKLA